MSINAYPVINIQLGKVSFNLYSDRNFVDFLDAEIQIYGSMHEGTGLIDIPVKTLKKALKMSANLRLDDDTVTRLQSDLALAKAKKEDIVTYYCF
jgi:hypothetical protein